jgi:hypothetical protein
MPVHGDYDRQKQSWFCSYWMTQEEWLDVHDYSPPALPQKEEHTEEDEK